MALCTTYNCRCVVFYLNFFPIKMTNRYHCLLWSAWDPSGDAKSLRHVLESRKTCVFRDNNVKEIDVPTLFKFHSEILQFRVTFLFIYLLLFWDEFNDLDVFSTYNNSRKDFHLTGIWTWVKTEFGQLQIYRWVKRVFICDVSYLRQPFVK